MATSEGIPSSIDIEFLELNDNPYLDFLIKRFEYVRIICYLWRVIWLMLIPAS